MAVSNFQESRMKETIISDNALLGACNSRKRRAFDDEEVDVTSYDVSNQNRFSILSKIKFVDTSSQGNSNNLSESKPAANSRKERPAKKSPNNVEPKNKFCPPIFIYDQDINLLAKQLEERVPAGSFIIKNVNKHKSKLYFNDASLHSEMMAILRENKVKSYSFTPTELKQISLVLRGLHCGSSVIEVKDILDSEAPGIVAHVSKLVTKHSKQNNYDTGLFLVTLHPSKTKNDIVHINRILHQTVYWEVPKNKEKVIQCRRCQHWGHIAKNCNYPFKCVKCSDSHEPGACSLKEAESNVPVCSNCGEAGHPASWRGCSSYKKYMENRRNLLRKSREQREVAAQQVKKSISAMIVPASFSDHYPLKLQLRLADFEFNVIPSNSFQSFKNTNWSHFKRDLDAASSDLLPPINRNLSNPEIDNIVDKFSQTLANMADRHSTKIELKNGNWPLPENIKLFLSQKHRWQKQLKRIYHRNGNRTSPEYNILSKQISLLKIIINDLIRLEQAKRFGKFLQQITPGPSAFKQINRVIGKRQSLHSHCITYNNISATIDEDKCTLFHNYYGSVFSEQAPDSPVENIDSRIGRCLENLPRQIYTFNDDFTSLDNEDLYHFTNSESVKSIIAASKNKKSCSIDNISNYILKKIPESAIKLLVIVFNNCLNNGHFPPSWKISKIIPIKKKNSSENVADFRPISLLSNIGKLFEAVLKSKIENEFVINPLSYYQFGFRPGNSTQHALLKLHSDIVYNLRLQNSTVAVSLDIQKAFDSTWHKGPQILCPNSKCHFGFWRSKKRSPARERPSAPLIQFISL
ncbi:uncharacterized protein LOC101889084 isoform X4 [Musca domestica]|uniref:Uncharacterized protein LOC101889084 isoform X4 n=1 Tax=Musca domestica TaxID=7370 RepID=A0ABM3VC41_MUSDO|nr:uncharacterized protein LOC101889084 isoform X4 [Musca domestica]